jgi:hypothetical protein
MALKVRDAAAGGKKFATRAAAAAKDYADGVRAAGQDWQTAATAAADNYNAAIQEAIARNAFARGVSEAGGGKFSERAATVGAQRFPAGVAAAEGDWVRSTQPYLDVIRNLTLPPRAPKGDPRNFARSQAIAEALRRRKVAG